MGEQTEIRWTDHTLNFWWGCLKVSPGCTNCYAETFSKRTGRNIWGPPQTSERWRTKGPWQDCLKWDKQAKHDGVRRKVFCQSMSDFFEDHPQVAPWRWHALRILEGFTSLDVQLLTKRPENVMRMVPDSWLENWPAHIWIGTSIENQEYADLRIPELLKIPAKVRFLSVEPLLGPVNIMRYLLSGAHKWQQNINWVIVGGESGPHARPMHPQWARDLRDQCVKAGVPYFFKQWGESVPYEWQPGYVWHSQHGDEWHQDDGTFSDKGIRLLHTKLGFKPVGKHNSGYLLDGQEWSEFPDSVEI